MTCAVSGGADSLALLVLACGAGCAVTAVHVDHGLRAGSGAEAQVVEAAAARFGAAFRSVRAEVAHGPNLEARARAARYALLEPDVLTGHTADDRAETVLVNMLRGTGLDGIGVLGTSRHPIVGLRRSETRALCADLGLEPVADPTNDDPAFVRNRVRHEILPLLDDVAGRDVAVLLARLAQLAVDDVAFLDTLAEAIDPRDAVGLAAAPVVLARRAVRRWLTVDGYPPDLAAVERVLAVARGEMVACEITGGRRVSRRANQLSVR